MSPLVNTALSQAVGSTIWSTSRLIATIPSVAPRTQERSRLACSGLAAAAATGRTISAAIAARPAQRARDPGSGTAEDEVDRDAGVALGLQDRAEEEGVVLAVVVGDVDVRLAENRHHRRRLEAVAAVGVGEDAAAVARQDLAAAGGVEPDLEA